MSVHYGKVITGNVGVYLDRNHKRWQVSRASRGRDAAAFVTEHWDCLR